MKKNAVFIKSIGFMVLITCFCQPSYAKMYKWVDENGKLFFSDKVPPTQKHLEREQLNKNAQVIQQVEKKEVKKIKVKTKDDLIAEARDEALKVKQKIALDKQHKRDKFLRSTFDSFEFMQISHKGRLKSLDMSIQALDDGLILQKEALIKQKEKLANTNQENKEALKKEHAVVLEIETKMQQDQLKLESICTDRGETEKQQLIDEKRYLLIMKSKSEKPNNK
ncbi:MAG: DUF4124 domain-containing protein [Methylococcales bacterium]|nr:DUF4124 domain-containing protein [Methylococcales bacterium]